MYRKYYHQMLVINYVIYKTLRWSHQPSFWTVVLDVAALHLIDWTLYFLTRTSLYIRLMCKNWHYQSLNIKYVNPKGNYKHAKKCLKIEYIVFNLLLIILSAGHCNKGLGSPGDLNLKLYEYAHSILCKADIRTLAFRNIIFMIINISTIIIQDCLHFRFYIHRNLANNWCEQYYCNLWNTIL